MKEFPSRLKPDNKDKFTQYRYDRNIAYMRKDIFELVLCGNENNYFELDNFSRAHSLNKVDLNKMRDTIMDELQNLGWNVKTSHGETSLFIYSTDDPPPSCWSGEF
jgi:hypothetical protein